MYHSSHPMETAEDLARLREDLNACYRPANSQERLAVERIALARQSILRAARLESSLFANPPAHDAHSLLTGESFKLLLRYQAAAERAYRRAIDELMFLQSHRPVVAVTPKPPSPALQPKRSASEIAVPDSPGTPRLIPAAPPAPRTMRGNLALV